MIPAISEINFPSYATLSRATVSLQEMGDRVITTQVKIDGSVVPDFTGWELAFKGERFILNVREPQAAKDNTSINSVIDLTFQSWVVYELKRYFFASVSQIDANTAIPDKYNASISLPLEGFVSLFNKVLKYYFGDDIRMDLYGAGQGLYSNEPVVFEINKTYIWDVLVKMYELYGVRWRIEYDAVSGAHVIKVGYAADAITDHDFEYGYSGGLLRFERQVQDPDIKNVLIGRGGERNVPYRYFKLEDPNATAWAADPDAIPELANIYFDRLRDINFRWYVRGWMQNEHRDTSWDATHTFPSYTEQDCPEEYLFAFLKGKTDDKFDPVEYVKDDESIARYGERYGAADDNDDVYPTIQGVERSGLGRIDEVVDVSPITTDDIQAAARASATSINLTGRKVISFSFSPYQERTCVMETDAFTVPVGQTANVRYDMMAVRNARNGKYPRFIPSLITIYTEDLDMKAVDVVSGQEHPITAIPAGTYYIEYTLHAKNSSDQYGDVTYGMNSITLVLSEMESAWKPTFDIWVKNIFESQQGPDESDEAYAARVWEPVLGDRVGNEAKVCFSDGFMSVSEDYQFAIASMPVKDRSKTILSGVDTYTSEWKITLYKSDAEFDATGYYIPNSKTGGSPSMGDHFFLIGVDMPFAYVQYAEERLNGSAFTPVINKAHALSQLSEVSPTWVISLDKVRCNTHEGLEYGQYLADRLSAGATVRIKDARFTGGSVLTLYVQSITYTWNEPTTESPYIVPDIEVVLSDKVVAVEGPVSKVSSDLEIVKANYVRYADVEDTVRRVGASLFLKKTGESDSSESPTTFKSAVQSGRFRQGDIGGSGWGFTEDGDGNFQLEIDKLVVRKELNVNTIVSNQVAYIGGLRIMSAASITCMQVVEDADHYTCYFDQKQGTVANLFAVNDIAMGQSFDEVLSQTRYYRMIVDQVGDDYIRLAKSGRDGAGAPAAGDTIVQFGNTTETTRQYAIVSDIIGGGYERMLSGLNSTSSAGSEYFFAGVQSGSLPRVFVGGSTNEYMSYQNGVLNIKGRVVVKKSDGTYQAMSDYIDDNAYLKEAFPLKGATLISGGLVLTSMVQLGFDDQGVFNVMSGINGAIDSTLLGRSIAAWYGGPMTDHEQSPSAQSYAKSLFRFDGSGYLASGGIHWDSAGHGGIPGISWSGSSVLISGDVKLESVSGDSVTSMLTLLRQINNWFGEDENGDIFVRVNNGTPRNFYSYGGITAGGQGTGGGGGGGIDLDRMWQSLTNAIADAHASDLIALAHIPDITTAKITDLAAWWSTQVATLGLGDAAFRGVASTIGQAITALVPGSLLYAILGDYFDASNTVKGFVNSSIATATATFRGTNTTATTEADFLTWANGLTHDLNDYVFWAAADALGNIAYKRYKYNGSAWVFEYELNNSSFTAEQLAAINSGITDTLVTKLNGIAAGAQVNVLESVKVNGTALGITGKAVNITDTDVLKGYSVDDLISAIQSLMSQVDSIASKTNYDYLNVTSLLADALSVQDAYVGKLTAIGAITGASFVKDGGTSAQFLKADGSVDSNAYALSSELTAVSGRVTTLEERINWDNYLGVDANGDVYVKMNGSTPRNFYSYGGITAGGQGTGGGGGGIDLDRMWASLTNTIVDAHASDLINIAHIPNITTGKITDLETWIANKGFITKAVNDLTYYYTKTEVNGLIAAIDQFRYEIAASTSAVINPQPNVLYLIGPTGSGSDKYEEYVYPDSTTGWVKIGDTTIDLSGYVNSVVASGSGNYVSGFTKSGNTLTLALGTLPTALKNPYALTFGNKTYDGSDAKEITAADLMDGHSAADFVEAIQSLMSQLDSVASRTSFDFLNATSFLADTLSAQDAYFGTLSAEGTAAIGGAVSLGSTLGVEGKTTLSGALQVGTSSSNKATTIYGTLSATGNTTIGGTLGVTGAVTIGSTMQTTGLLTAVAGLKLTTTPKIWFGDTYYIELVNIGTQAEPVYALHTNIGIVSDSFMTAGAANPTLN